METIIIIWMCLMPVFGTLCGAIAEYQGRNGKDAFVIGLIGGVIALIFYLIIGKTPEKRASDLVSYEKEIARLRNK